MTSGRQRKNVEFTTVQEESKEEKRAVSWLCGMLGVSRSGYYKWLKRDKSARNIKKEEINVDTKKMLDKMHKQKIDMSDEILVINVNGYIGESTKLEIEYALRKGKNVTYLEEN